MWLFLAFVAVPIIEIALFIQVGGWIGLWPTLAIVVLTAFAGTILMRMQGLATLQRLQSALAEGGNPADPIAQGAMILVAGVLLLTPGFFTDALGFALLLPPVRVALIRMAMSRVASGGFVFMSSTQTTRPTPADKDTIDADYSVLDETGSGKRPGNPSGWTNR